MLQLLEDAEWGFRGLSEGPDEGDLGRPGYRAGVDETQKGPTTIQSTPYKEDSPTSFHEQTHLANLTDEGPLASVRAVLRDTLISELILLSLEYLQVTRLRPSSE